MLIRCLLSRLLRILRIPLLRILLLGILRVSLLRILLLGVLRVSLLRILLLGVLGISLLRILLLGILRIPLLRILLLGILRIPLLRILLLRILLVPLLRILLPGLLLISLLRILLLHLLAEHIALTVYRLLYVLLFGPLDAHLGKQGRQPGQVQLFLGLRCLIAVLRFVLFFRCAVCYHHKPHKHDAHHNGHIDARRLLDIAGHIAKMGNAEGNAADNICSTHQGGIHIVIGIALGAETFDIGVILIRNNLHNAVGDHRLGRNTVCDDITDLQLVHVHRLHINKRAYGIRRLHGTAEHTIDLKPEQTQA